MARMRLLVLAAVAAGLVVPVSAAAQQPKLEMSASASPGTVVTVSTGPCETFSAVTSPGFQEPITLSPMPGDPGKLHGAGQVVTELGTYTATVQCDAKTLTATFSVRLHEVVWSLSPAEVEPGGTIYAEGRIYDSGGCAPKEPLTSPGFAAPLEFHGGNLGRISGSTKVITTPGTYEVAWQCANRPERSVKTFRILGTPPTTTPSPPGKPPIVKPKGAPQTGGGGTA